MVSNGKNMKGWTVKENKRKQRKKENKVKKNKKSWKSGKRKEIEAKDTVGKQEKIEKYSRD